MLFEVVRPCQWRNLRMSSFERCQQIIRCGKHLVAAPRISEIMFCVKRMQPINEGVESLMAWLIPTLYSFG